LLQNLKIKQIDQEIRLFLQLIQSKGGVSKRKITLGGRDGEKVKNHLSRRKLLLSRKNAAEKIVLKKVS